METAVLQYIMALGLNLSLSLLIAFRAGRRWSSFSTANNFPADQIFDLAQHAVREEIKGKLQDAFDLYFQMPTGQHYKLPGGASMDPIALHLHSHLGDLNSLQTVYLDLANHGFQSGSFQQALTFAQSIFGTLSI